MFHIFKLMNVRNRAYVVDNKGNKLFFGTEYQCKQFIDYMTDGSEADVKEIGYGHVKIRENSVFVEQ